ncbi:hypothetical protein CPB85DRAFT_1375750 [Mucidula mucida]|nr:hypothetical protein CPB85DRAFT_1375750 [Mucidula mucida]
MTTRFYTFNTNSTSISYSWPKGLTGLERIALSSQGDLQRVLSAFFSRPIQIVPLTTHTRITISSDLPDVPLDFPNDDALSGVSSTTPITQTRQVLLQCAGRTVCTATSTVRITSPHAAKLFLVDKYPIGQMFRKLEKLPDFELLDVDFGLPDFDKESKHKSGEQLWRKYRLFVDGYEAEILEVFPSRRMFQEGEAWLKGSSVKEYAK